eukprot:12418769-Karenia_brevis.AAC.1
MSTSKSTVDAWPTAAGAHAMSSSCCHIAKALPHQCTAGYDTGVPYPRHESPGPRCRDDYHVQHEKGGTP